MAAMFLGVLAAIKMSATIGLYLKENTSWEPKAIPIIAFIIILIAVGLIVTLIGKVIETALGLVLLGPINKLAGAGLYLVLYAFLISTLLYFTANAGWVHYEDSWLANKLAPFAPSIFEFIRERMPLFSFFNYFENI